MFYVYILKSIEYPDQLYIGYTSDIFKRLDRHNAGYCEYTALYKPWKLVHYLAFEDKYKALEFEKYLKSDSGRVFRNKRLIKVD